MTSPTRHNPLVLLIADDDPDDRLLVRLGLAAEHVANPLEEVMDGESLLARLRDETRPRPGLILLDLNMPRQNGFEILAELQASPDLRGIPVVVLTTSGSPDHRREVLAAGAVGFVTKPLTRKALLEAAAVAPGCGVLLVESQP